MTRFLNTEHADFLSQAGSQWPTALPVAASLLRGWPAAPGRQAARMLLCDSPCCLPVVSRTGAQRAAAAAAPRPRALHATAAASGGSGGNGTPPDHFARLGYPAAGAEGGYAIDATELKRCYQALQRDRHPDALWRGVADDALDAAVESAHINLSYMALVDPLSARGVHAGAARRGDPRGTRR